MYKSAAPAPGMRVLCRDAEWLVTRVDPSDTAHNHYAVHCVGADDLVRGHQAIFLTQLDRIDPVDPCNTKLVPDQSSGYRLAKLFLEAQLRQMPATGLEPDLVNIGAFTTLNFQVQAVRLALAQLRPRLLLADTVGLGKTIQVGMILSELMRRGRANRILVLAKKSMLTQFQAELWNRFGIPLVRLDSAGIAKLRLQIPANKNPFEVYHRVIISMDTLKNVGSYRHFLENTRWDCVVIDEAHNVAGASVPEKNLSYRLARLLARRADSMLLTTATPHNGKRQTFGRLISLLDPSAIPDPEFKEYSAEDIEGFFLMRFKEDVREDVGDDLKDRLLVPLEKTTVEATPLEEEVYTVFAEQRAEAKNNKGEAAWKYNTLLQYGIYKQFLSSPESCHQTVTKRIERVQEKDIESPELPYLTRVEKLVAEMSIRDTSRYQLLKQQLEAMGWDGSDKCPRVLIFTEFRATQDALAKELAKDFKITFSEKYEKQASQVLAIANGSCPDVHLMKIVEAFGTGGSKMRMLLATDVASEGVNLHHQCHNIVHYDLPWSIITLVQRNGRIDRIGQKENPVLRYLQVSTDDDMLKGDEAIFEKLIEKVEEINRSTRQGETVLKLYDSEAEERYIAKEGLQAGDQDVLEKPADESTDEAEDLESILKSASPSVEGDYLEWLLGDAEELPNSDQGSAADPSKTSRFRLYQDKDFLTEGYRFLSEFNSDYPAIQSSGDLLLLNAPADLRRRLGSSDQRGDVVFGGTAIPAEAWTDGHQFRFTDDPDRVALAIEAARNTSGHWSKELLCTDQHPVLKWITERLLMLMKRGECPHITSRELDPGELCFCFIGQVSSQAGSPLVVDAHAISFQKGGTTQQRPLSEMLESIHFQRIVNEGNAGNIEAIKGPLIEAAVEASRDHMRDLADKHINDLLPFLRREERRLRKWRTSREEILDERLDALPPNHPKAKAYRRLRDEMDEYLADRQENWRDMYFKKVAEPSTQLVLVIEGVG